MQSGVSSLMRSRISDRVTTCNGFCMRSFRMAYSVLVNLTSVPSTAATWRSVMSVMFSNVNVEWSDRLAVCVFRRWTDTLAKSSFM